MKSKINRSSATGGTAVYDFSVTAETWRFYAYLAFWSFVLFAKIITYFFVVDRLAAGPINVDDTSSTCGPFNLNDEDLGIVAGQGFDYYTQNHLISVFGYANICSAWDYSPSRELTSMVYPVFEYLLIVYINFDFMATALAQQRGEITPWFWTVTKFLYPLLMFLCSQFRQIFVNLAYEQVAYHTMGFLGLQIALVCITLHNSYFIYDTNTSYEILGGLRGTKITMIVYLIGNLTISLIKIVATLVVVREGAGPAWYKLPSNILAGKCMGEVVDLIWMLFNALIPFFIANVRRKKDVPFRIVISQDAHKGATSSVDSTPLNTGTIA